MSEYRVQFLVYFAYMNLQISFAFLMATYFSYVRTASGMLLLKCSHSCFVRWFQQIIYFHYVKLFCAVTGYLFTIGSGYLAEYLFRPIFEDMSLSSLCPNIPIIWLCLLLIYLIPLLLFLRKDIFFSCVLGNWTTLMEFFPPFSLYRIIYEFSPPPSPFYLTDFSGIQWGDLSDRKNGMKEILIIMAFEWATFLLLTFFLDEFGTLRNGIRKMVSVCHSSGDGNSQASQKQTIQLQESEYSVEMDRTDVLREVNLHIICN